MLKKTPDTVLQRGKKTQPRICLVFEICGNLYIIVMNYGI